MGGAIAGAQHVRLMAKHYGVPVVLHSDHCAKKLLPWFDGMLEADEENISTCAKYFKRMAAVKLWLEMEIGITGGEEDGVDNTVVKADSLYTKAEQVRNKIKLLSPISPM